MLTLKPCRTLVRHPRRRPGAVCLQSVGSTCSSHLGHRRSDSTGRRLAPYGRFRWLLGPPANFIVRTARLSSMVMVTPEALMAPWARMVDWDKGGTSLPSRPWGAVRRKPGPTYVVSPQGPTD
jgi:hypothetical protein